MVSRQFENETESTILSRMLERIDDGVDKRQGSVAYDLSAPASQEFAQAYAKLDDTLRFAFLNEDMPSELLDVAANDFGVTRKQATKAKGTVTFSGPVGQFVSKDTLVRTDDGVYFTVLNDVSLTGPSVEAAVEAVEEGASGNLAVGELNTMVGNLVGIVSVTNASAITGGVDTETDESLLERIFGKIRKPATSGNVYHYEQWAKEVSGISDAKAFPVWNGPGTVKVVLLDEDKRRPTDEKVAEATAHIEANRPIGADVTVVGATESPINISADLTLLDGRTVDDAIAEINANIEDYLKSLAFAEPIVRYAQIAFIILNAESVVDYENLTVNGGASNIPVEDGSVAVLGAVTLNGV